MSQEPAAITKHDLDAFGEVLLERIGTNLTALVFHREQSVGSEFDALENRMMERAQNIEITLIREFHEWALRFESTVRASESHATGLREGAGAPDERVADLEN